MATATPTFGAAPLKVTFKGSGSSDPDGDALRYEWDFGDGTAKSTSKDPVHTYDRGGNFDARLKVTDARNASATATVRISVDNSPPVATLTAPLDGAKYRDGAAVQFSGSATDKEDGALAGTRLSWTTVLVHGNHVHSFQTMTGKTGSFTTSTDHDADSFYRVTLTATDSQGLTDSKTVVLRPETVSLSIASNPAGAPINYAGYSLVAAPHQAQAAIGFRTSVAAGQRFVANGRTWEFASWRTAARSRTTSRFRRRPCPWSPTTATPGRRRWHRWAASALPPPRRTSLGEHRAHRREGEAAGGHGQRPERGRRGQGRPAHAQTPRRSRSDR